MVYAYPEFSLADFYSVLLKVHGAASRVCCQFEHSLPVLGGRQSALWFSSLLRPPSSTLWSLEVDHVCRVWTTDPAVRLRGLQ